jgi:hypothetical protein
MSAAPALLRNFEARTVALNIPPSSSCKEDKAFTLRANSPLIDGCASKPPGA